MTEVQGILVPQDEETTLIFLNQKRKNFNDSHS